MRPWLVIERNLDINIISAKGKRVVRITNSYVPGIVRLRSQSVTVAVAPHSRMKLHNTLVPIRPLNAVNFVNFLLVKKSMKMN